MEWRDRSHFLFGILWERSNCYILKFLIFLLLPFLTAQPNILLLSFHSTRWCGIEANLIKSSAFDYSLQPLPLKKSCKCYQIFLSPQRPIVPGWREKQVNIFNNLRKKTTSKNCVSLMIYVVSTQWFIHVRLFISKITYLNTLESYKLQTSNQ